MSKQKIYIIKCEEFCKIGISHTPKDRLTAMQTGNPFPMKVCYEIDVPDGFDPQTLESECHKKMSVKHHRGEWFKCHPLEALRAAEHVLNMTSLEVAASLADSCGMFNGQGGRSVRQKVNRAQKTTRAIEGIRTSQKPNVRINGDTVELLLTKGCGIKKNVLLALGESWPPRRGWKKRLLGCTVPKEVFDGLVQQKQ
jgi:hypothetical protein